MSNEQQQTTFIPSIGSSNDYGTFTALTARLDTRPLLDDIELWLRGSIIRNIQDKDGKIFQEKVVFGVQKANDEGIQSILSLVSGVINSHFVQGNWSEERYVSFISEFHQSLRRNIWINLYNWEIKEDNYPVIVQHIILSAQGFASRLINNKERESYGTTFRTIESPQTNKKEPFSLFRR